MNYDGRIFRAQANSEAGEVSDETRFVYAQEGDRLTGTYSGGAIVQGHLLGRVLPDGRLRFCYHHESADGTLQAGQCTSTPSRDSDGRLVLHETWQWFTGARETGTSVLVEVTNDDA